MKTLRAYLVVLLAIVIVLFLFQKCSAADEIFATDKAIHFGAGLVVSQVTYPLCKKAFDKELSAKLCAFSMASLVGLAKEIRDSGQPGNRFDGKDLAATMLGGATVFLIHFEF